MSKQLLTDTVTIRLTVQEDASGSGKLVARGEFARANTPTANKRIYPESLWKREITRLAESIQNRKVYGLLDHPSDGKTQLSKASHILTGLALGEGGIVDGSFEVLDTDNGKTLKAILDAGGSVGVSSRGFGSVKLNESGFDVVQDDYNLLTFDCVADPANTTSYPQFTVEGKKFDAAKVIDGSGGEIPVNTNEKVEVKAEDKTGANPGGSAGEKLVESVKSLSLDDHNKKIDEMKKNFAAELVIAVNTAKESLREEEVSRLMTDPKIAGAKIALEQMKGILRPFVMPEDVEKEMARVEGLLKDKTGELEGAVGTIKDQEKVIESLTTVARDLGFNLYLERKLSKHPKFQDIVSGLGDLSKIESMEDLKNKVKIHEDELPGLVTAEDNKKDQAELALESKLSKLEAQIEQLSIDLKVSNEEKELAVRVGLDSAARAYLERKVMGHPAAPEIRKMFESIETKTKEAVDKLVEGYDRSAGSADFQRIRSRLGKNGSLVVPKNLVENSLSGTVPEKADSFVVTEGFSMPMKQMLALSGMKRS